MATRQEWRRYMRSTDVHAERKRDERELAREERQRLLERKAALELKGRRVLYAEGVQ